MMATTTSDLLPRDEQWQPVAYVSIQDAAARAAIVSILERAGWAAIQQPTGFHLVQAIAGVIDGHHAWQCPCLIVIDARSRGCSGATIATGLRDLGITILVVLVAAPGETLATGADPTMRVVDVTSAAAAVAELVNARSLIASA
jgi:FixJ family two-component response regulator